MLNKENKGSLVFPPLKFILTFLAVTILGIICTAFSGGIAFKFYFQISPEWEFAIVSVTIVVFCIVNFRISRGSRLCANILKYYLLLLVCLCLPALIIQANNVLTLLTVIMTISTFFLISGKTYQQFVIYQRDFFQGIKEAQAAVELELKKNGVEEKLRNNM